MKFTILLSILFDLLAKRRVTATYLSGKYGVSPRTVYRYVEHLATVAPVFVKQGRNGGIFIADNYKLPMGFMTESEYEATIDALTMAYTRSPEERFLIAKRKLSSQEKNEKKETEFFGETENFITDGGSPFHTDSFLEKFRLLQESLQSKRILNVEYHTKAGSKITYRIEPHILVHKQTVWYVYAFCHERRAFRLFALGRISALFKTDEVFRPRPFDREAFFSPATNKRLVPVRFEIEKSALSRANERFGAENVRLVGGKYYVDAELPDDERLADMLLGFGTGIQVISPPSVRQKVIDRLCATLERYRS